MIDIDYQTSVLIFLGATSFFTGLIAYAVGSVILEREGILEGPLFDFLRRFKMFLGPALAMLFGFFVLMLCVWFFAMFMSIIKLFVGLIA